MSWISEKICQIQNVFASYTSNTDICFVCRDKNAEDLRALKVTELKTLAKEKGLKGYTNLRKAKLIELLNQN